MESENGNLLDGETRPSRGAGRFEVRAALAPWGRVGRWPRSDRRDAEPAFARCAAAVRGCARLSSARRRAVLVEAAARLEAGAAAQVAAIVGLDDDELTVHRRGLVGRVRRLARGVRPGRVSGVALIAPHWSELFAGVLLPTAREFLAGRSVLLLADPRVPPLADLVAAALLDSGLPPAALAVLHGADEEAWEWLIAAGVVSVTASGARERVAGWRRHCETARTPEPRLTTRRSAAWQVPDEMGDEDAARTAIELAFGRVSGLFGQCAGQVRRVYCPERRQAAFTATLLAALEESEPVLRPLPLIDRAMVERTRDAWARGLDRGAVLIHGGRPPAGEAGHPASRLLLPTVFTNAEVAPVGKAASPPVPVLSLHRLARARRRRPSDDPADP